MKIKSLTPSGLLKFVPKQYDDQRGFFSEVFQNKNYQKAGVSENIWLQDNLASSKKGTLRGLHFQKKNPQAKLIYVLRGMIFDVALDIRPNSKYFGSFWSGILSSENRAQLYIPKGFAHGYQSLTDDCLVFYKCSDYYQKEDEGGIFCQDLDLNIQWPLKNPLISEKDEQWPSWAQFKQGANVS